MAAEVIEDLDSAGVLLAAAREQRAIADQAEATLLQYAAHWAAMHSTDSLEDAAAFCGPPGCEEDIPIAGEGAPLVAEFCVAEFAAAPNLSTDAGRKYLGNAIVLLRFRHARQHRRRAELPTPQTTRLPHSRGSTR